MKAEFNYGETIENILICMSIEEKSTKGMRGAKIFISHMNYAIRKEGLTNEERQNCSMNLEILKKEINSHRAWLDKLNAWRIKTYN